MTKLEPGEPRNEKVNDLFSVPDTTGVIKKNEMGTDRYEFLQKYPAL
jgi:hypothetical protein